MRMYFILFVIVQILSLSAAAQQAAIQTTPLPCTTENRDPSQPWLQNSKVLDSFPKDNPVPRFIGTFRDKNQSYMLDLYQDANGVFGELSSPVLDADSPTSRLYDVAFNSGTSVLQFTAKFLDGHLQFSGILRGRVIEATVTRNKRTEKVSLKRDRHSADEEVFFKSRAQFDCAMTLWRRF
jgi:hypothetical protein